MQNHLLHIPESESLFIRCNTNTTADIDAVMVYI